MQGGGSQRRTPRALERWMPLTYFVAALALVTAVLPSVLRQVPPEQNQTAEFSPDAPPDDEQQAIIASLNRGVTGTAGTGTGEGIGDGAPVAAVPDPVRKPRSCGRGYGNPPRQTESLYSPPCAPAFVGDNGGATYHGVSANEVRINIQGVTGSKLDDGPITETPSENENDHERTVRVLATYLNQAYQLYGRKITWIANNPASNPADQDAANRAAVAKAAEVNKVFGSTMVDLSMCDEYARRRLVAFCPQLPADYFEANAPHLWSWYMDGTKLARFTAEYACKKLHGKPAIHAGDPLLHSQERAFGLIYYDNGNGTPNAMAFKQFFAELCGGRVKAEAGYTVDSAAGGAGLAQVVTKMQVEGVTTVIPFNDYLTNAGITAAADQAKYYPEWVTNGFGAVDRNALARLQARTQWENAFGFTSLDMERRKTSTECYRAYKAVDPAAEPSDGICNYVYAAMAMIAAGIQQAGPNLTPQTFQDGLFRIGYRFYDKPVWAIGGGYGPGDFTYTDNVAEIWWDPSADEPNGGIQGVGAYKYVRQGKRYQLGQFETEDTMAFVDGVTVTDDSDDIG